MILCNAVVNSPIVGIVVTISPSLSLYRIVVLPAASSPTGNGMNFTLQRMSKILSQNLYFPQTIIREYLVKASCFFPHMFGFLQICLEKAKPVCKIPHMCILADV